MPFHAVMILSSSPGGFALGGRDRGGTHAMDRLVQFIDGEVQFLGHGLDGTQSIRDAPMLPIPLIRNIVTGAESAGIFCILQHGLVSVGVQTKNFPSTPSESASVRNKILRGASFPGECTRAHPS